jgi:micrococcal nuclease
MIFTMRMGLSIGVVLALLAPAAADDGYEDFMPAQWLTSDAMEALDRAGKRCPGVEWNSVLSDYHRLYTDCMEPGVRALFHAARVIDGDTVERDGEVFRFANVDTPETDRAKCVAERALGEQAKLALSRYILHSQIRRTGRDKYGRTLALFRDSISGADIGQRLIDDGLAVPYDGGPRINWCDR